MLGIFSWAYWLFVLHLWRNVYSNLLPILKSGFFFSLLSCRSSFYIIDINPTMLEPFFSWLKTSEVYYFQWFMGWLSSSCASVMSSGILGWPSPKQPHSWLATGIGCQAETSVLLSMWLLGLTHSTETGFQDGIFQPANLDIADLLRPSLWSYTAIFLPHSSG